MGQILNRIFRITRSNFSNLHDVNNVVYDEDDVLKKIIDELNNHTPNEKINDHQDSDNMELPTAYKILQIDELSSIEEIKTAYKTRIKEYHPDRLQNFGDEIKVLAISKTKQVNLAYSLIKEEKNF